MPEMPPPPPLTLARPWRRIMIPRLRRRRSFPASCVISWSVPLLVGLNDLAVERLLKICGVLGCGGEVRVADEARELRIGAGERAQQALVDRVLQADRGCGIAAVNLQEILRR